MSSIAPPSPHRVDRDSVPRCQVHGGSFPHIAMKRASDDAFAAEEPPRVRIRWRQLLVTAFQSVDTFVKSNLCFFPSLHIKSKTIRLIKRWSDRRCLTRTGFYKIRERYLEP